MAGDKQSSKKPQRDRKLMIDGCGMVSRRGREPPTMEHEEMNAAKSDEHKNQQERQGGEV